MVRKSLRDQLCNDALTLTIRIGDQAASCVILLLDGENAAEFAGHICARAFSGGDGGAFQFRKQLLIEVDLVL